MAERGRCGGCGGAYTVTGRNVIRRHGPGIYHWDEARGDVRREDCPGAGMPPIGPDEPLHATELRDVRREIAELTRENGRLRALAAAEHHRGEAFRLRAESLECLRKIADIAMEAMDRTHEQQRVEFEARMDAINAEFGIRV